MKSEKVSQFIIKLIKLTKSGELIWESVGSEEIDMPLGDILGKIYEATINNRRLQLYRYKIKYYNDEFDFEWIQKIKLELLDDHGKPDYDFEYDNSINDLYNIVREHTSNVSDFIDDILGLKLEIISAKYYTAKQSKDVTFLLQSRVFGNSLIIEASNDIDGDPEENVVKKLKVKYRIGDKIQEKEVTEGQTLILP
jgi:hypothetical protein